MATENLPKKIAIFPLPGAIFFPKTTLPLNIFEKRYIKMVSDCMKEHRFFGMIQPKFKNSLKTEIYKIGCLGKIVSFNETNDNRFLIVLSGISRFKIKEEIQTNKLYREFCVDYTDFENDLLPEKNATEESERKFLTKKIKKFFERKNYLIEFNELKKLDFNQMLNTICMIAPFSIEEKQKLIETIKMEDKIKVLENIIDFHLIDNFKNQTIQ